MSGRINSGRVVGGGATAALVIFLYGTLSAPLLPDAWTEAMTALGGDFADPAETWPLGPMLAGFGIQLVMGVVVVWLYAAILPRFGEGPRTAAIAGVAVWLIVGLQVLSLVVLGSISLETAGLMHGPQLIGLVLAAIAGARVYREAPA